MNELSLAPFPQERTTGTQTLSGTRLVEHISRKLVGHRRKGSVIIIHHHSRTVDAGADTVIKHKWHPIVHKLAEMVILSGILGLRHDDLDEMFRLLQAYLLTVPYCDNANSEGHYQQMLYIIFSLFGRYVEVEVHTPTGRVDIVMKTDKALYLFELKLNKSAEAAMQQIDLKEYPARFALCGLPVVKIGINFDAATHTISDWEIVE